MSNSSTNLQIWSLLLKIEISVFDISSENTGPIVIKPSQMDLVLVLFKNCVRQIWQPSNIIAVTKNRNIYFWNLQWNCIPHFYQISNFLIFLQLCKLSTKLLKSIWMSISLKPIDQIKQNLTEMILVWTSSQTCEL